MNKEKFRLLASAQLLSDDIKAIEGALNEYKKGEINGMVQIDMYSIEIEAKRVEEIEENRKAMTSLAKLKDALFSEEQQDELTDVSQEIDIKTSISVLKLILDNKKKKLSSLSFYNDVSKIMSQN